MKALLILLTQAQGWAEEATHGAHAGGHEVPWSSLGVQAFNFVFLFLVLFVVLRKSVAVHFENRAREYSELVERAEAAKAEAEKGKIEIQSRLEKLQASAANTVNQARSEAEELRRRLIDEAQGLAVKLEQEARRTAAVELEKSKAELRRELLKGALENATQTLSKDLSANEQKKLQNEFVEKIQVVGG